MIASGIGWNSLFPPNSKATLDCGESCGEDSCGDRCLLSVAGGRSTSGNRESAILSQEAVTIAGVQSRDGVPSMTSIASESQSIACTRAGGALVGGRCEPSGQHAKDAGDSRCPVGSCSVAAKSCPLRRTMACGSEVVLFPDRWHGPGEPWRAEYQPLGDPCRPCRRWIVLVRRRIAGCDAGRGGRGDGVVSRPEAMAARADNRDLTAAAMSTSCCSCCCVTLLTGAIVTGGWRFACSPALPPEICFPNRARALNWAAPRGRYRLMSACELGSVAEPLLVRTLVVA